jgi:hypothetical protein
MPVILAIQEAEIRRINPSQDLQDLGLMLQVSYLTSMVEEGTHESTVNREMNKLSPPLKPTGTLKNSNLILPSF